MIDFIGIGAQKCATSWIYEQLISHKDICIPKKEFHFFSRSRYEELGIKWYEDEFKECKKDSIKGEFSTSYLYEKGTAKKIYDYNPNIKIIVSLRNPVKRAFSNYLNDIMGGNLNKNISFNEALKINDYYIEQGYYYSQLQEYLKYFSKEQIHIILFEDIKNNPDEVLENLFKFLNIDIKHYHPKTKEAKNVSRIPKNIVLEKTLLKIADILNSNRYLRPIYRTLKKVNIHTFLRKINTDNYKPVLSKEDYDNLIKLFEKDMNMLKKEFNLDISKWSY